MLKNMNELLNWVGTILFFLIFMTVAENLVPGKNYNKYVRLSAGMVLILLVLKPVTGGFHLEEQINRYFEAFTFQQDAKELSKEILGIEEQRLGQVIDSYEQAVETDVKAIAEEMGLVPVQTRAVIERNRENSDYGRLVRIEMEVGNEKGKDGNEEYAVQAVNPVEPVQVMVGEDEGNGDEPEPDQAGETLEQLRRKVEGYYGLETGKVEIKFQGRQR